MTTTLNRNFVESLDSTIEQLKRDKVYKQLNHLDSPQSARVQMEGRGEVLILSSNNYLGLCDEPEIIEAGIQGLRRYGAGTGSVRFICGTFTIHRELEDVLDALSRGERPSFVLDDEAVVYDVTSEILVHHRLTDAAFKHAVATLTEQQLIELVGVAGYYGIVSMFFVLAQVKAPK